MEETVDFPVAMEPVSPSSSILSSVVRWDWKRAWGEAGDGREFEEENGGG